MVILSKGCKRNNFEQHNSLKLSFTNIRALHSNFVECEFFFESNSPNILALCETNLDDSVDSGNFGDGLPSLNPKRFYYSYAWSCSLNERTSVSTGLTSTKLCGLLIVLDQLQSTQCLPSFSSIEHLLQLYATLLILFHLTQMRLGL